VLGRAIEDVRAFPGSRPQHLLITLLGDYWYQREESISADALTDLLAEFGVPGPSARSVLAGMARRGLLELVRADAGPRYRITPRAAVMIAGAAVRIFGFGLDAPAWDGTWTRVVLSAPEAIGRTRRPLIRRLRWLGFAPLRSAWYAPGDRTIAVTDVIAELGVAGATVASGLMPGDDPIQAWDLDAIRSGYEAFVSRFAPVCARARRAELGMIEALMTRTAIIDIWRSFLSADPGLPGELLPPDWPLQAAAEVFRTGYDLLGPLAFSRVRQVLARHDPAAAKLAGYHTAVGMAPSPA
jgi:phenylacetic acid degradation operon negative regulatory protein